MTPSNTSKWNQATAAVGYASLNEPRVRFGFRSIRNVKEIEICWPSGIKQILQDVTVDQILTVEEPPK